MDAKRFRSRRRQTDTSNYRSEYIESRKGKSIGWKSLVWIVLPPFIHRIYTVYTHGESTISRPLLCYSWTFSILFLALTHHIVTLDNQPLWKTSHWFLLPSYLILYVSTKRKYKFLLFHHILYLILSLYNDKFIYLAAWIFE